MRAKYAAQIRRGVQAAKVGHEVAAAYRHYGDDHRRWFLEIWAPRGALQQRAYWHTIHSLAQKEAQA